jgi:hypothetical protein
MENKDLDQEQKQEEVLTKPEADYKADMFKYKQQLKDTQARLQELEKEKQAVEKAEMARQNQWKQLFEQEKAEKSKFQEELNQTKKQFVDSAKKNAVISSLGGLKKNEYTSFINTDSIDLNDDGTINADTLNAEVARIKQNFPELLKTATASLPKEEAKQVTNINNNNKVDKASLLSNLLNKKK